jgi:acetyltransferase-like isoleucine patch superfamily enzyme
MKPEDVELDPDLRRLWDELRRLRSVLRDSTRSRYGRINPFDEDLFDWKEKGEFAGGKDVTIYDSATVVGEVRIGDHTWIGPFCSLDGTGGLTIGSYCSISSGTHLMTHDTVRWALSGGRQQYEYSPIRIGDHCFLGVNSVVTRGVSIGDRCVVGAGAVVTADLPPLSIAAGVPARMIGRVAVSEDGTVELQQLP